LATFLTDDAFPGTHPSPTAAWNKKSAAYSPNPPGFKIAEYVKKIILRHRKPLF
jgi:hypothetical protein